MPIDQAVVRRPKFRFLELRQEIFAICSYDSYSMVVLTAFIGWHTWHLNHEEKTGKKFDGWIEITQEQLRRSCFGMVSFRKLDECLQYLKEMKFLEFEDPKKLVTTSYRLNIGAINAAVMALQESNEVPDPDHVPNRKAGYEAQPPSARMPKEDKTPSARMPKHIGTDADAPSARMPMDEGCYKEGKFPLKEPIEEPSGNSSLRSSKPNPSLLEAEVDYNGESPQVEASVMGSAGLTNLNETSEDQTYTISTAGVRSMLENAGWSISRAERDAIKAADWDTETIQKLAYELSVWYGRKRMDVLLAAVFGKGVVPSASFRGGRMSRSSQPKQSRYGAKTQPSVDLGEAEAWSVWFKDAAKHAQPLMDAELPLLAECLQDKDFRNNSQKMLEALDACASSDSEWKPTLSWAVRGNPKNWTRVVAGEFAPKKISRKSKDFDVVDSAKDLVKRMREKGRL